MRTANLISITPTKWCTDVTSFFYSILRIRRRSSARRSILWRFTSGTRVVRDALAKAIVRAWGMQSSISAAFEASKRNDYVVVSCRFSLSYPGSGLERLSSRCKLTPGSSYHHRKLELHLFLPISPSTKYPTLNHQHAPGKINMAQPLPPNHGSPKFHDRHREPHSPTQRQTIPCDMLVYVRDLENPSHRQRSQEAAFNAVTHPQWASSISYDTGRIRDLWAGSPDALEFMQGYDRVVTRAKWLERTFEAQDQVDWISNSFRNILGQGNVQGRSKKALFQHVMRLVRNWTGVRYRNLDHCLSDDIVWRDQPDINRRFGQEGSDAGNALVHNSDIVMDAMLCRAPDFLTGHHNGTSLDSQKMTALFRWLTRLSPDVAMDIGKSD